MSKLSSASFVPVSDGLYYHPDFGRVDEARMDALIAGALNEEVRAISVTPIRPLIEMLAQASPVLAKKLRAMDVPSLAQWAKSIVAERDRTPAAIALRNFASDLKEYIARASDGDNEAAERAMSGAKAFAKRYVSFAESLDEASDPLKPDLSLSAARFHTRGLGQLQRRLELIELRPVGKTEAAPDILDPKNPRTRGQLGDRYVAYYRKRKLGTIRFKDRAWQTFDVQREPVSSDRWSLRNAVSQLATSVLGDAWITSDDADEAVDEGDKVTWGKPYGTTKYRTPEGALVAMYRKGQRVRFYDEDGQQVGPEQSNVAPAVFAADAAGWKIASGPWADRDESLDEGKAKVPELAATFDIIAQANSALADLLREKDVEELQRWAMSKSIPRGRHSPGSAQLDDCAEEIKHFAIRTRKGDVEGAQLAVQRAEVFARAFVRKSIKESLDEAGTRQVEIEVNSGYVVKIGFDRTYNSFWYQTDKGLKNSPAVPPAKRKDRSYGETKFRYMLRNEANVSNANKLVDQLIAKIDANESFDEAEDLDGKKVRARGHFAKGLSDGTVYTLKKAAPFGGQTTYNFVTARGKSAARFTEGDIRGFLRTGQAGDSNGLVFESIEEADQPLKRTLIAKWVGKRTDRKTMELYHSTHSGYVYKGDGSSGALKAKIETEAIKEIEAMLAERGRGGWKRADESLEEATLPTNGTITKTLSYPKAGQDPEQTYPAFKLDKATLFLTGEMFGSWNKYEVNDLTMYYAPYAQHERALWVTFRLKGKRKYSQRVLSTYPRIAVFKGWNIDLEPESMFGDPVQDGPVIVKKSRRMGFDKGWDDEMEKRLADYKTKPVFKLIESDTTDTVSLVESASSAWARASEPLLLARQLTRQLSEGSEIVDMIVECVGEAYEAGATKADVLNIAGADAWAVFDKAVQLRG